jgi:hypothetical protein
MRNPRKIGIPATVKGKPNPDYQKAPRRRKGRPYLSHGSEGMVEHGQRMIADPLEPGQRYEATVNVRESSIDHMHSRGRINTAQNEAGQRFRRLWEKAAVGRNQAMDPSKEFVDGGGVMDPISDELVKASIELAKILRVAGPVGSQLLMAIVGEGKRIEDTAKDWSRRGGAVRGDRAEGYVTGRMIEALDDLVRFWKLESDPIVKREEKRSYFRNGTEVKVCDAILVSTEGHIGPATELTVGRFGDIVEDQKRGIDRAAMMPHTSGNR